jgi:hypothetical protein
LGPTPKGCVTSCAFEQSLFYHLPGERDIELYGQVWPKFPGHEVGSSPSVWCEMSDRLQEVTGLDGWSSRNMWRPCVWPPEHPDKALKCTGGKLSICVPYVQRSLVWDDFDMSSDKYASQDKNGAFQLFSNLSQNGTIFKRTSR